MELHMVNMAYGRQIYARVMSEASVYSSEPRWRERGNPCLFAPEFSTVTVLHHGPSDDPVRLDYRMRRWNLSWRICRGH